MVQKRRSALGVVVHKSDGGNRPASPQSFKLASTADEHGMFYKHRAGTYAPDLRISRRKYTSSMKLAPQKILTKRYTGPLHVC
ncbi:hypothetical protein TNCV_3282151 [Trichonephila clavipes]|nr:hypothetical protein TNCV_3282151 [Trichonephila clavipes]